MYTQFEPIFNYSVEDALHNLPLIFYRQ